MKHIIFVINAVKLLKYNFLSEDKKIKYLKKLRDSILSKNKISKALDQTGDLERSFVYSSLAWVQMSEYCMYCKKEGLDVRVTFKRKMRQ